MVLSFSLNKLLSKSQSRNEEWVSGETEGIVLPAVIFKGENYRIFRCDKCSLLDGLNYIL